MDANRIGRIIAAIGESVDHDPESYMRRVCAASLDLLSMSGAGVSLMTGQTQVGAVWGSDSLALKVEDLQFALGEGPAPDAFSTGTPALEPCLAEAPDRWPFFGPAALDLGVAAVFSFPLQIGVIQLGALNLFRETAGFISSDELADALVLCDVVTQDILDLQDQGSLRPKVGDGLGRRVHVFQATGMVAAQMGCDPAGALASIRAFAFAHEISIFEVADRLIAGSLRLDGDL